MRVTSRRLTQRPARLLMLASTLVVGGALAWSARAQAPAPGTASAAAPTESEAPRDTARMRLSSVQVQQAFQHIDTNRDGSLSRGEVSVFPRIERHFERIDSNRDGVITPAEFETALQQAS